MSETDIEVDENEICKIRGLDLILASINCEKYTSKLTSNGINEHTMLHLTADDLRRLEINDEDMHKILEAINILNQTSNFSGIQLSNEHILKLQSNICGELGSIVLMLNRIYCSLNDKQKHFNDVLIDDSLSSIDAAMMVKPYLKAEENNVEKSLKHVYKMKKGRSLSIIKTVCIGTVLIILYRLKSWRF